MNLKILVKLVGKNKEAFDLMRNPKTGARNTDLLIKMAEMMGGGAIGGIPGALGSALGTGLASKGINKLLTSPTFRQKIVQKMIENKQSQLPGRTNLSALISSLMSQQGGQ